MNFELDPVDEIAVVAEGEPGQRRFFLVGRGRGQVVTLACEKFLVQGLVTRIGQLLQTQGQKAEEGGAGEASLTPNEPRWAVGELGIGFHQDRKMFVIVAREAAAGEAGEPGEPGPESQALEADRSTLRLWLSPDQLRAFSQQAQKVLSSGRPTCQHCGLPIDPAGHPCPAANGARPIF